MEANAFQFLVAMVAGWINRRQNRTEAERFVRVFVGFKVVLLLRENMDGDSWGGRMWWMYDELFSIDLSLYSDTTLPVILKFGCDDNYRYIRWQQCVIQPEGGICREYGAKRRLG